MNLDVFRESVIKNPSKEISKCKILGNYSALLKERSHKCNFEIRGDDSKVLIVDMGSLKLEYSENLDLIKIVLKELGNRSLPMLIDLDYLNTLVDGITKIDLDTFEVVTLVKPWNTRRSSRIVSLFAPYYLDAYELARRIYGDDDNDDNDDDDE